MKHQEFTEIFFEQVIWLAQQTSSMLLISRHFVGVESLVRGPASFVW